MYCTVLYMEDITTLFEDHDIQRGNICFHELIFHRQIRLISCRSEFWHFRRKTAVIFSKWLFFQKAFCPNIYTVLLILFFLEPFSGLLLPHSSSRKQVFLIFWKHSLFHSWMKKTLVGLRCKIFGFFLLLFPQNEWKIY